MQSKRSLTVIKELEPPSPKRKLYVTHKVLETASVTDEDFKKSFKGIASPQKAIRKADGTFVPWSILGDTASYEHLESGGGLDANSTGSGGVSVRTSRSSRSRNKTGSRSSKKSASKLANVPTDPNQDLKDHIASLAKFMGDAQKVRSKEKAEEEHILTKLPVHEIFSLNKEGKALSKWQERLNDWSKIENRLARRVGGSTKSLLMNTGDEYRGKNEEYDLMQAAIPVEEKFGPNSWMMMLRGGGEQNVPVGHIFSGLVCKITTKQVIPKMLRKPMLGSEPRTKDTFVDNTPAMTMKRDKLKKKIDTIRPYSMGPSVADGLIVFSTNLFDWAHDSSKRILIEREESARCLEEQRLQHLLEEQNKNSGHIAEDPVSSLRVLTPVNMVFACVKGEGIGNTFTFTNTGRATVTYAWTCDSNRYDEAKRPVWTVLEQREEKSREFQLTNNRALFFCPRASGRILPGETIHSSFIYCNRGSGGSVSEQWVLQLSPQATVTYADSSKRTIDGESGSSSSQSMPPTSKITVVLRGQSYSLDESAYRRKEIANRVLAGTEAAFARDLVLQCVRRVRTPVRSHVLQQRKIDYFLKNNAAVLNELSEIFGESMPLYLNYERLEDFDAYYVKCQQFLLEMHKNCVEIAQRWKELSGVDTKVPHPNLGESGSLRLRTMREAIFPEGRLEIFDEITENDINVPWDYDLTRIFAICISARFIVALIIDLEVKIEEKIAADDKAAARATRKAAAGSDDESEEEEEEGDDDEPKPVKVHPLTALVSSVAYGVDGHMHRLVVRPQSLPAEDARAALVAVMDTFEDLELASRAAAEIAPESEIPIFESPFISEAGKAKWEAALNPPPEPEETGKKGAKKAPEKKDKKKDKGATNEIPIVEPEQANIFYKHASKSIVTSVVDSLIDSMFCAVNTRLTLEAKEQLKTNASKSVPQLAVLRKEDIPEKGIVFMSIYGPALYSQKQRGAFDIGKPVRTRTVEQVVLAAENGAACVVLLCESLLESDIILIDDMSALQESLGIAATTSAQRQEQARPKPRKKDPPLPSIPPVKFKLSIISNFAELDVALQKVHGEDSARRKSFPVFVLQDIKSPNVVPADLYLPDEVEEDDDCPIPVGVEEHHCQRLTTWNYAGPKRVGVSTVAGVVVHVFAGAAEALADILERYSSAVPSLWVECNPAIIYAPLSLSASQRCADSMNKKGSSVSCSRVLSNSTRDFVSWFSIIPHIPRVPDILAEKAESEGRLDAFSEHLYSLFKNVHKLPTLLAVVGGSVRLDKFSLLDKLLDSASVIFIAGELCIPFIAMVCPVEFIKYVKMCESHKSACAEIMKKARLRGVKLVFPVDIVEGDEGVSNAQKSICFEKIEPGARDEGADYPGETKTIALPKYVVDEGVYKDIPRLNIGGHLLDMGPTSCQELKELIEGSEVLLSWGTVGCVEMSSFQAGQRVLVTTAAKKPYSDDDEPAAIAASAASLPLYSLIMGDSAVEWWSRIADSEGEIGGDISRFGIVSCASRVSSIVCGLISLFDSPSVSNMVKREGSTGEWLYNCRSPPPVEEEEDEDEDDD